jgi:hypothetical protein
MGNLKTKLRNFTLLDPHGHEDRNRWHRKPQGSYETARPREDMYGNIPYDQP